MASEQGPGKQHRSEETTMSHELSFTEEGEAEMFSVRETPWHKLGIVLDNPPTAEEGLKAAHLDWQVGLNKLYRKNEFGEILEVERFRIIERMDNGTVLGLATEDYTPLQNQAAFAIFNPLVQNGFANFETAGALHHGRNVWVQVKLNITDPRVTDVLGDEVVPYAMIDNSHSGTRSVRLTETPQRVVCKNTLMGARAAASRSIKIVHGSKVEANLVQAARELWKDLVEHYVLIANDFTALKGKFLDEAMFRKLVANVALPAPIKAGYANPTRYDIALAKHEEKQQELIKLWTGGTGHSGDHSAWEAYNAYTEWFDHIRKSRGNYASAVLDGQTAHTPIFAGLLATKGV
jgi:phage/plasmid-like protein (TIGR03299 family)